MTDNFNPTEIILIHTTSNNLHDVDAEIYGQLAVHEALAIKHLTEPDTPVYVVTHIASGRRCSPYLNWSDAVSYAKEMAAIDLDGFHQRGDKAENETCEALIREIITRYRERAI